MGHDPPTAVSYEGGELPDSLRELRLHIAEGVQSAQRLSEAYSKHPALHECLLFLQRALICVSEDSDDLELDPSVRISWKDFSKRLKRRRMQANLGQKQLADLVDISEAMIRAIEGGQRRPSRAVLLRLLATPQLGLRLEDVAADAASSGVVPTSWLAPHYNPTQMITDMVELLNGAGGSLEQTMAYLDYQSAKDCLDLFNSPDYLAAFSNTAALEQVARRIATECGAGGLDIVALGCGDAKREVKLVEHLIQYGSTRGIRDIRLFLLDISHCLLTAGHAHAREVLEARVKSIIALHGNFHDLSKYPLFSERDLRTRTRVFTLLGCTLTHLNNEVRFFRDTLSFAARGDYFLTDFNNAYAPADAPEQIRAVDPLMLAGIRPSKKTWLSGPLHRYVKGFVDVEFSLDIDTDCPVRGSYEMTYVAHVTIQDSPLRRRFAVFRVKRYDVAKLEECLSRSGWQPIERLDYGANDRSKITLSLLRRS